MGDKVSSLFTLLFLSMVGCTGNPLLGGTSRSDFDEGHYPFLPNSSQVSQLVFTQMPSLNADTDHILESQPILTAQDQSGNRIYNYQKSVTLSAFSSTQCTGQVSGGLLDSEIKVTAVAGKASFSGLQILKTSVHSLLATDGLLSVCSSSLFVGAGAAVSLKFVQNPSSLEAGSFFFPAIQVVAEDAHFNQTPPSSPVIINLANNPESASLTGVSSLPANTEKFFYSSLSVNYAGIGNTLVATSGSLSPAISTAFNVTGSPQNSFTPQNFNFSNIAVGAQSQAKNFTFTNAGTATATGCSAAILTGTHPSEFILNDQCGTSDLKPGQSCTISVIAKPTSVGVKATSLSRTCTVGETSTTANNGVTATGANPAVSLTPLSANFGSLPVLNASNGISFTFSNTASVAAQNCSPPTLTGTNPGDFQIFSDSCDVSDLQAGASCVVIVRARPTSAAAKQATLTRTCAIGGTIATTTNSLLSSGTLGLSWAALTSDFGSILTGKTSSLLTFQYQNQSGISATGCNAPSLDNLTDFTLVTDLCGTSDLAPFSSCTVSVKANPGSTATVSANLSRTCAGTTATKALTALGIAHTPSALSLGANHTCALLSNSTVQCWGSNNIGQLGDATFTDRFLPTPVSNLTGVSQIVSGQGHTCALISGAVKCWGQNSNGQLGNNSTSNSNIPVSVIGLSGTVVQLAASFRQTCALITGGTMQCWGNNSNGQFGNGTTNSSLTATSGATITDITLLSMGQTHSCALILGGTMQCWGDNSKGQLGDGTVIYKLTPTAVPSITGATAISTGNYSSCAIIAAGAVQCWGNNLNGQGGNGTNTPFYQVPTAVATITGATKISAHAGGSMGVFTCALIAGAVNCWGLNQYGQLGDGTTNIQTTPVAVAGIGTANQIYTGQNHACAILTNNSIRCWGSNGNGQIGNGIFYPTSPTVVTGLTGVLKVGIGYNFTCVLITGGTVKCWGLNSFGQLGDGTQIDHLTPQTVPSLTGVIDIGLGASWACAILTDRSVQCWGYNPSGQLGNTSVQTALSPTPVFGITNARQIAGQFGNNTCATLMDGTVQCWGSNGYGQVGDGSFVQKNAPTTVTGITNAIGGVTGGNNWACTILNGGSLACWGTNGLGLFLDGTTNMSNLPVTVGGIARATQVSSTADGACVTLVDQTVRCWSANTRGEAGNGTTSPISLSVSSPVTSLSNVSQIASGVYHNCTLLSDKTVKCWGYNTSGQVGDSSFNQRTSPVPAFNLTNVASLWTNSNGSAYHSCAIKIDQTLACWGDNTAYESSPLVPEISEVSGF